MNAREPAAPLESGRLLDDHRQRPFTAADGAGASGLTLSTGSDAEGQFVAKAMAKS